ncbi:hypothetical protein CCACVL1_30452 [Corchorus capsularis]|uniref:Uncharacterized protein n=1 Tax=Corchorus capsularis TaxID=210143 RepID=A0A1R3FXA6_COCAP|nr:hypothetical protein CCACVL1_30452 [Corchorus capsularis]
MEALPAVNDQETPEYPPGFAPNQGHGSSTMAGQTFNMPTPPQNTYSFQPQYASQANLELALECSPEEEAFACACLAGQREKTVSSRCGASTE